MSGADFAHGISRRLGDVLTFRNEIVHPRDHPRGPEIFVGLEHIERDTGCRIGFDRILQEDMTGRRARFRKGDIVYGYLRPYLNKVWIAEFDGLCSVDQYVFQVQPVADLNYVAHYLRSSAFLQTAPVTGNPGQLPRIRSGEVANTPIPLPPLSEQKRIAAILDEADALRAKRRAVLAKLDNLNQSIFIEMFGDPAINPKRWPISRLGDLAKIFSDGPFGSNLKSSHYVETGVRVVRLQNIGVDEFIDEDRAYISEDHFESLRKHECLPGDVLVGTLGDPNLRACIQPDWLSLALNKADCVQIRVDETRATNYFLAALLNCPSTESLAQSEIFGQTRSRISMGRLRELKVPVPPLSTQLEFSDHKLEVEEQRVVATQAKDRLAQLFASLQHRAFRGEL